MTVHDFDESLAYSHSQADAPYWEVVYKKAFPNFAGMVCVRKDGWAQRGGIDRVITFKSGKTVTVDEKARKKVWPDVALERWSDEARKKPGWMQKDLACDFIAYAWVPKQRCLLLPFPTLRRAWLDNGRQWIKDHKEIRAENHKYTTVSVAVPTEILMKALQDAMLVEW